MALALRHDVDLVFSAAAKVGGDVVVDHDQQTVGEPEEASYKKRLPRSSSSSDEMF